MTQRELNAYATVQNALSGRMTTKEAAEREAVNERTLRRWKTKVLSGGAPGLVHGNRGRPSPHRLSERERTRIITLIKDCYSDFAPTLATEKLAERHDIFHDPTTIRDLMVENALWIPKAKRSSQARVVHRHWRERKAHVGELVQFDGSYHHWFEDRGGTGEVCLLATIDDAAGTIPHACFAPHEGVLPVMGFWRNYIDQQGLPKAIYLDRFSTYKMHLAVARDNPDLKTQLQRAMKTLGVELIFALSPQAKGRVERLFGTLQDRLVKELRLQGISSVTQGNAFLKDSFLPGFNARFSVSPRETANFHRPVSGREMVGVKEALCRQEWRTVQGDFTISFRSQWYQLLPTPGLAIRPKDEVNIREHPDSTLQFFVRHKPVKVSAIAKRSGQSSLRRLPGTLAPLLSNRTFSLPA